MADLEHGLDTVRTRRTFLREAAAATMAFVAVGCSPGHKGSRAPITNPVTPTSLYDGGPNFGSRMDVGKADDLLASIASTRAPHYVAEARAYVVAFPADLADRADAVYPSEVLPLLADGLAVLYQRCTHLGCRVPWCPSSRWFECPCHGAKFDGVGELRVGPAPRGMDLMNASIERGRLVVDTGTILDGVRIGTDTTHQAPAGPYCVFDPAEAERGSQ